MNLSRSFTVLLTLSMAGLGLTACGGEDSADASPDNPVTISVTVSNATEPYVIPWLVAQDQGFFEERGVIVEDIVPSKGGSTTVRNMLSGDLPIAEAGFTSVLESQEAGAPVAVVGGATRSVYGLDFYALASNEAVQDIDDIQTWSYTNPESVTEALTYMLPEAAGADTDVERTASGGIGEGIALLESGDVDAAVVPPSVVGQNPDAFREVVSSADYLESFQQSVITTTPEYAESHPGVLEAITGGYQEAVEWIGENPEDAGQLYADYSDIDPAIATEIVENATSYDNWSAGLDAEALETAVEAMTVAGFEGGTQYCELFDLSYLPQGAPAELPAECN
jgi:NitT/TauT family transport system substrate-binding protein